MKSKISAVACTLAMLVWMCAPVHAEFLGKLKKNQLWTLEVIAASANPGDMAVTVVYVYANGTQDTVDSFTVAKPVPGEASLIRVVYTKIPRGVRRIVIQVNVPERGGGIADVRQGDVRFEVLMVEDRQLVLDVVDEP